MNGVITKRTAILVVVLAALSAWLAAAVTSGVRPVRPAAVAPAQIDLRGEGLSAEIERLHDRLRPSATPDHGRNLFQFGRGRAVVAPAPVAAAERAAVAPAAPAEPPFKLIGIAEDNGVRTAILTSPGQLLMVKEGDSVASTYRVTAISGDAIVLTANGDGSVLRLALK